MMASSLAGQEQDEWLRDGCLRPKKIAALMVPAFDSAGRDVLIATDFMQDRIDLDAVAAHMHGPAPPDKHKESARFMQPLLGEVVSTIKSHAPASAASSSQSPESAELAKAKRKLQEAGIALTPEKKPRAAQNSPSSTGPSLPTKGTKTPAEEILEKELTTPPSVPGSTSNEAVEKWLKKHQSQFRGKASAFKKHVADICSSNEAVEKWLKKHQSQFRGKASAFKKHVADICSVFQASEATSKTWPKRQ
eukprot:s3501_g4.t1